jgi:hypothetical protein
MRAIALLLIPALVLTPTLAHAINDGGGVGALALVALPALAILLVVYLATKYPATTEPSPPPGPTSESLSLTGPAPAVGSDR